MSVEDMPGGGGEQKGPAEVPASEVKNAWHEYLDRVSQAREEILVTRYGKPIVRLVPVEPGEGAAKLVGFLEGTVTIHGDIVAPVGEAWAADV